MANVNTRKGVIGILTGGGDVPGLNPAIRALTIRALREGFQVIGLRHGWAGLVETVRENEYDNTNNFQKKPRKHFTRIEIISFSFFPVFS